MDGLLDIRYPYHFYTACVGIVRMLRMPTVDTRASIFALDSLHARALYNIYSITSSGSKNYNLRSHARS